MKKAIVILASLTLFIGCERQDRTTDLEYNRSSPPTGINEPAGAARTNQMERGSGTQPGTQWETQGQQSPDTNQNPQSLSPQTQSPQSQSPQ
jgi:hypothetical protein